MTPFLGNSAEVEHRRRPHLTRHSLGMLAVVIDLEEMDPKVMELAIYRELDLQDILIITSEYFLCMLILRVGSADVR